MSGCRVADSARIAATERVEWLDGACVGFDIVVLPWAAGAGALRGYAHGAVRPGPLSIRDDSSR
ncbi:hypothetical protein Slu03_13230 [Sediminihabitans luteus]|nr:hypothetical protein Slu03_13230 [Sediminihabitans luteus]